MCGHVTVLSTVPVRKVLTGVGLLYSNQLLILRHGECGDSDATVAPSPATHAISP